MSLCILLNSNGNIVKLESIQTHSLRRKIIKIISTDLDKNERDKLLETYRKERDTLLHNYEKRKVNVQTYHYIPRIPDLSIKIPNQIHL